MSVSLRWVDESEYARVGETRLRCYNGAEKDRARFVDGVTTGNPRVQPGDCLLAERNGRPVGTATAVDMRMWVRGGAVPCQGVAWVGTVKTGRRASSDVNDPGVATRIMNETIRRARERELVVSALMPFRGSFYEHFGYGIMERRSAWTVPISIFPKHSSAGIRFFEPADLPELQACRQRIAEQGQCDIERPAGAWEYYLKLWEDGLLVVDRPDDAGPIRGWMSLVHVHEPDGSDTVRVLECAHEDASALKRQLGFLGSLRDQYTRAIITLPSDVQLNRILREPQITHRDNRNHPTPEVRPYTRMQSRVLDHKRFIEAMRLPDEIECGVGVDVHETEGHVSKLWIEIAGGHATVSKTTGESHLSCRDTTWATLVMGDLKVSEAIRLGLVDCTDMKTASHLDVFSHGPQPFTHEYF